MKSEYYSHYGVEAIDICWAYGFHLGNVIKYLMRAGFKTPDPVDDLIKASDYLQKRKAKIEAENLDSEFDLPKLSEAQEIELNDRIAVVEEKMEQDNPDLQEIFTCVCSLNLDLGLGKLNGYIIFLLQQKVKAKCETT